MSNLDTTSIITALIASHVNRQHHRFFISSPNLHSERAKVIDSTSVFPGEASNNSSGRLAITVVIFGLGFSAANTLVLD